MTSAHNLLREVQRRLDVIRAAKKLNADRYAPGFNMLDLMGRGDEMFLSRILCWLLDPNGSHGQGSRFLSLFTARCGGAWADVGWCGGRARVEVSISTGRLDILVEAQGRVLVVENKTDAGDGDDQLARYFAYLDAERAEADKRLVYLTSDGRGPPEQSLCREQAQERRSRRQFWTAGYRGDAEGDISLQAWLDECRLACRADRVGILIDEIKTYLRMRFEGVSDMSEQDEVVAAITDSERSIDAAFQIANSLEALKATLIDKLVSDLSEGAGPMGWTVTGNQPQEPYHSRYSGVSIHIPELDEHDVVFRISFESSHHNSFIFGTMWKREGVDGDVLRILRGHPDLSAAQWRSSHWWPWYAFASPDNPILPVERNWGANPQPWVQIRSGDMADMVIRAATLFCNAVQGIGSRGVGAEGVTS